MGAAENKEDINKTRKHTRNKRKCIRKILQKSKLEKQASGPHTLVITKSKSKDSLKIDILI